MKKTFAISLAFIGVFAIFFLVQSTSAFEMGATLEPKGQEPRDYTWDIAGYSNTTENEFDFFRGEKLNFYWEPIKIVFESQYKASVFLFNRTQFLVFCENRSANWNATRIWDNTTSIDVTLSWDLLMSWGVSWENVTNDENVTTKVANMYFVVLNENDEVNRVYLKVGSENEVMAFFGDFFSTFVFVAFFILCIALFRASRKEQKEDRKVKAKIYRNYGLALFFGGLVTCVWTVYNWIRYFTPSLAWSNPLEFNAMPIDVFGTNILAFVSFLAVGLSMASMSYTVEKDIQQKKYPYFTIFLMAMEIANIVFAFITEANLELIPVYAVIMWIWIGSAIVAAANILITYAKIVKTSAGRLKKQAIHIMFSLTLAYVFLICRLFINPEFIANGGAALMAYWFYKSGTMK
ncbi:MAG: hypothetical protein ACFFCS_03330 [Candidatus Hodarchaeota archaeon]